MEYLPLDVKHHKEKQYVYYLIINNKTSSVAFG